MKKLKMLAGALILLGTLATFIHYAVTHPALFETLKHTNPWLILLLVGCYCIWFLALVLVLRISMHMYEKPVSKQENLLLNAYSSLINFFGPGQSGPAFRGLYLKKRHGLPIKSYIFATLLYYAFYAVFSAFLLFAGSQAWWKTTLVILAAGGGSFLVIRLYIKRSHLSESQRGALRPAHLGWLAAATALQVAVQAVIFFIELKDAHAAVTVPQALTYTGAANFSLFVSLTPGAIGIREAFLVFSQGLHHLSSTVIVAASVIDRAVYLLFLGVLFVLVLTLHAKDKLRIKYYTDKSDESA